MARPKGSVNKKKNKEIDFTKWIENIPSKRRGDGVSENAVLISFLSTKNQKKVDHIHIKLGRELIEKLNWAVDDRITILNHRDDMLQFMLVKREAGHKLRKINNSVNVQLSMTWKNSFPLQRTPSHAVDYEIHKSGYLIFRARMGEVQ